MMDLLQKESGPKEKAWGMRRRGVYNKWNKDMPYTRT